MVRDPEVAKGIQQAEDGEYDLAILTLDEAARRLAGNPDRAKELSQVYLYLGIAYLTKGHETLAKARFKDALSQDPGLTLSPDRHAPKVLELFERAREDLERSRRAAAPAAAAPQKRGSRKVLVLAGIGAAAAAGIAVAGGGGGSGPEATAPTARTETGTVVNPNNNQAPTLSSQDPRLRAFTLTPRGSGLLEATLTWNSAEATLDMYLWRGQPSSTNSHMASSIPEGASAARLTSSVTAEPHQLNVIYSRCRTAPCPDVTFSLTIRHP